MHIRGSDGYAYPGYEGIISRYKGTIGYGGEIMRWEGKKRKRERDRGVSSQEEFTGVRHR